MVLGQLLSKHFQFTEGKCDKVMENATWWSRCSCLGNKQLWLFSTSAVYASETIPFQKKHTQVWKIFNIRHDSDPKPKSLTGVWGGGWVQAVSPLPEGKKSFKTRRNGVICWTLRHNPKLKQIKKQTYFGVLTTKSTIFLYTIFYIWIKTRSQYSKKQRKVI